MLIDCDTCAVRNLRCHDCVIGVLLNSRAPLNSPARRGADDRAPVELDPTEQQAIGSLVAAGLVPPLRLVALPAPADPERGIA